MEQYYKKENRNSFWYIFGYVGRISRSSFIKTFVVYILIILVLIGIKYLSLNNPTSDTSVTIGYDLKIARVSSIGSLLHSALNDVTILVNLDGGYYCHSTLSGYVLLKVMNVRMNMVKYPNKYLHESNRQGFRV